MPNIHIHLHGRTKDGEYEVAKAKKERLYEEMNKANAILQRFPKGGPMGMTDPEVAKTAEFKKAKADYETAFQNVRKYNEWFTKTFKKEYAAERNNRFR